MEVDRVGGWVSGMQTAQEAHLCTPPPSPWPCRDDPHCWEGVGVLPLSIVCYAGEPRGGLGEPRHPSTLLPPASPPCPMKWLLP